MKYIILIISTILIFGNLYFACIGIDKGIYSLTILSFIAIALITIVAYQELKKIE